jgi:hypothetical protein
VDSTSLHLLLAIVLPVWIVAGVADYACHRATRIESTSGWRESALHAAQLAEVGIVIVAALLVEPNGGLVAFCLVMIAAHEATAYVDLRYASSRRLIAPLEQMVHSFLEILPLSSLLLTIEWLWPALPDLVDGEGSLADFAIRPARHSLPPWYVATMGTAIVLFGIVPYAEELWRCLRQAGGPLAARPATAST